MEWETRPLTLLQRSGDWHSSINATDSVVPVISGPIQTPSAFMSRRRQSTLNPPPLGPPPDQPIPQVPNANIFSFPNSEHDEYDEVVLPRRDSESTYAPTVFQRPRVSSRLAAVTAFSEARYAAGNASSNSDFSDGSSNGAGLENLSDPPPPSQLPQNSRRLPQGPPPPPPPQPPHPNGQDPSPPDGGGLLVPSTDNNRRPSSRRALTRALELAREAVRLDSTNDDPYGAIMAYGQSVALLNEVMERVRRGEDSTDSSRRRNGRRRSIVAQEEEVRRLKSIHDTYADRMNILSLIYSIPPVPFNGVSTAELMQASNDTLNRSESPTSSLSQASDSSTQVPSAGNTEPDPHEYQTELDDDTLYVSPATLANNRDSAASSSTIVHSRVVPSAEVETPSTAPIQPPAAPPAIPSRMSILPPPRPPPAGPLPGPPLSSQLPSLPARPRTSSTLGSQTLPPITSPPQTPTIVEPPNVSSQSPRKLNHIPGDISSRSRGNSISHKRTGSAGRLAALKEEAAESLVPSSPTVSHKYRRNLDVEYSTTAQLTADSLDSHPLPPIPLSPASEAASETPVGAVMPERPSYAPSSFITPRSRGGSTLSVRSDPITSSSQLLINQSTGMGTISRRRKETNNSTSSTEPSIASTDSLSVHRIAGLPYTDTSQHLTIGRLRAASQPVRPYIPQTSNSSLSVYSMQQQQQRHSPNLRTASPLLQAPQTAFLTNSFPSPYPMSTSSLLPPPAVLPNHVPTTPTSALPPMPPADALLKPYHLLNLLHKTMTSKSGGYITRRLHVPHEVWSQGGAKLPNILEKCRVVEILCEALMELQNASVDFCGPMGAASGMGLGVGSVGRKEGEIWSNKLEDFSAVCDQVVSSFGKKLAVGEGFIVRKSTGVTSWGGKLSRQFDKLTNARNLDSPANYVSGLMKLLQLTQLLDEHTKASCTSPISATYAALPGEQRTALEIKFKRISEFFARVVLTFVIRDLSLLLDKYAKTCEKWLAA